MPPCTPFDNKWFVLKKFFYINTEVYDKLFNLLDKTKVGNGNYRVPFSKAKLVFTYKPDYIK